MGSPSIAVVTPWRDAHDLAAAYKVAVGRMMIETGYGLFHGDRLIVVDNGSTPPIEFAAIRFDENRGFAAACNAGLHAADTDAVLFLNNDVAQRGSGWLDEIRGALRPGVLVGPDLRIDAHTAVDGRLQPYLDGWCLAGMREDLLELGGFDESFEEPSYFGDNDLCARARAAGFKLVEVPVALRHLGNWTAKRERLDVREVSARNYQRYAQRVRELAAARAAA